MERSQKASMTMPSNAAHEHAGCASSQAELIKPQHPAPVRVALYCTQGLHCCCGPWPLLLNTCSEQDRTAEPAAALLGCPQHAYTAANQRLVRGTRHTHTIEASCGTMHIQRRIHIPAGRAGPSQRKTLASNPNSSFIDAMKRTVLSLAPTHSKGTQGHANES